MKNHYIESNAKRFLITYSPPGAETELQKIVIEKLKTMGCELIDTDVMGNVVGAFGLDNTETQKPTIMLAAHADEIAWQISHIDDDGKIYVVRLGGSDQSIAASKFVKIHTRKHGMLNAVFGWPAIHVRDKDVAPELDNICIDAGYSKKTEVLEAGIQIGNIVTYENDARFVGNTLVSKAIDNKMGVLAILAVADKLLSKHPDMSTWPFILRVASCIQEETGLHGSKMVSNYWEPDVVLVTDVCHATDSFGYEKKKQGDVKLGKGPVIVQAAALHRELTHEIIDLCDKYGTDHQLTAAGSYTGTDAEEFAYAGKGAKVALIKMPLKYMHTTVEMVNLDDVAGVADIMYMYLHNLIKTQNNANYGKS